MELFTELGVLESYVVVAVEGVALATPTLDAWRAEQVAAEARLAVSRRKYAALLAES